MAIECPQCGSFNGAGALHCDQCGKPLGTAPTARSGGGRVVGVVIAFALVLAVVAIVDPRGGTPSSDSGNGGSTGGTDSGSAMPLVDGNGDGIEAGDFAAEGARAAASLVAGWLQFEDRHGQVLGRIPTAASRSGWVTVPRRAALGSERWVFRPGLGGETTVVDGVWSPGEPVGLWRIESPDLARALPLEPWIEDAPIAWVSYSGNRREEIDPPVGVRRAGLFLRADAPAALASGGILLQEGAIVGWVSGAPDPAFWLWADGPGVDLDPERTVSEFYTQTFAGGQEEALAAAHALNAQEGSESRRLLAYADALKARPRLREADTREMWLPVSAIPPVAKSMRALIDQGAPQALLDAIGEVTVRALGDPVVFILWVDAIAAVDGPEIAIDVIDRLSGLLLPVGSDPALEEQLLSRLLAFFAEAVSFSIDRSQFGQAWTLVQDGRRRFPTDPSLALIEAELLLDEGDWRSAEAILQSMVFPARDRDRVALLERRISDLRGIEGKIVIRFRPGAPSITTHADVSGVRQLFVVDTGASFTSIPWSTVRALGIQIDANTPRRELRTASDVITAPVVTLPGISLGGWTVEGVEATVLDLPGNDGVGLLGLNFLGSFRVDLDREEGTLTLEPK